MGRQPAFDRRMFVGAIVVADSDAAPASGKTSGQRFQEGDELEVPMAAAAASVDLRAALH
jgi:hypothetical protein